MKEYDHIMGMISWNKSRINNLRKIMWVKKLYST